MPADAVALVANVMSVKGSVQVRPREGAAWQPVTVGMRLEQGAEIRTGLRSAVQFTIGDDQTITLDQKGRVRESNEDNNSFSVPGGPALQCVQQ